MKPYHDMLLDVQNFLCHRSKYKFRIHTHAAAEHINISVLQWKWVWDMLLSVPPQEAFHWIQLKYSCVKLKFCVNLYRTMSDYFYSVNIPVSCFLLVSTVISRTGLLCGLFLCIVLHLGGMKNGLGNLSIPGNGRNSQCGLQNKSSSYCNVNNMMIVLHGLVYIVFEDTLSMIPVSDREEALWFQRTSSKNACEDYCSKFCTAVSLVDLDFLTFRPLQLAGSPWQFKIQLSNTGIFACWWWGFTTMPVSLLMI